MTDDPTPPGPAPRVARAEVRKQRFFSIVWLVPLVALIIGGWLAYRTVSERGPSITITFKTADGIVAGKTKIKYKAIDAGTVESVRLSKDLSHVIVKATMVAEIAGHLKEGSRFWVVQPEITFAGVTGLNTLVSGDFIAFEPGEGKTESRSFKGLNRPPVEIDENAGHKYYLQAQNLGSISKGAPIYYKGVTVGKIVDTYLAKDDKTITVEIFINKPQERLVREGTLFWNVSGVNFDLGDILNASLHVASPAEPGGRRHRLRQPARRRQAGRGEHHLPAARQLPQEAARGGPGHRRAEAQAQGRAAGLAQDRRPDLYTGSSRSARSCGCGSATTRRRSRSTR